MEVGEVDPGDRAAFDEWFAVVEASVAARWPGRPGWLPDELRGPALDPDGPFRTVLLAAREGGRAVGAAWVELPLHDNPHLAQVTLEVHPARRRRGAGRALVGAVERLAAADGRRVVFGWEEERLGPAGSPAVPLAEGLGYAMVLEQLRRELEVPFDEARAAALESGARPHAGGYEIVTLEAWPEEWLADRAAFGRHMSTDPPLGGLALDAEAWGAERVRSHERRIEAMGRRVTVAAAVDRATGRPVAFSELTVSRAVPEIAYQWDTLVLPSHRGHRLGLLVKVANLRRLGEISPETRTVVTWNARDNEPMIAVNEALGARVVAIGRTWQKRL
jgi:GNAT superfamily N-acetyltransferase